jgi:RNA polymerase sigma factor (sigma-70 family)
VYGARTKETGAVVDQLLVAQREEASIEAIEMIYRSTFHRFVRVAQAITRSREPAVDAVQEAFASVLRNRHAFRGSGSLEAWVWRSVVNAARRFARERATVPLGIVEASGGNGHVENHDVRSVIAALPERQRLVLFLRYYADLDYSAIAEALELEVGTVGATLNQARGNLRRRLTEMSG